ncbi:MAG: 50S ribosomal protein P1 [DPANN group archaeon]|nr:50S ribosomal protein P1 [DPANN group archaeon]
MEYVYAAMLLHKAGKGITEDAMEKVLTATGVAVDKGLVKATVSALKDVDIEKVISEAAIVQAAPAAAATSSTTEKKGAPKVEEKKVTEEEAAAGLGALFG